MAKRPPRQELRATPARAPYRRTKAATAPPATSLDLPVPAPPAAPTPAAPTRLDPPMPAPMAPPPTSLDLPMPAPHPVAALTMAELPDLMAVVQRALGFADAALTYLPPPSELVHRDPASPEPPPGRAPRGDARSMRSDSQFALIYRSGAAVVSRRGKLGEHGVWRVVEYPGAAQAAHAYAVECSRLVEQGFHDVA